MAFIKSLIKALSSKAGITLAVALGLFSFNALAGAAGAGPGSAEIDNIYDDLVSLMEGPIGKIAILLAFGFTIYSVFQRNWPEALSAFLAGIIGANIGDLVSATGLGGTVNSDTVEVLPVVYELPSVDQLASEQGLVISQSK